METEYVMSLQDSSQWRSPFSALTDSGQFILCVGQAASLPRCTAKSLESNRGFGASVK